MIILKVLLKIMVLAAVWVAFGILRDSVFWRGWKRLR
jgi:hypothetical protein